MDTFGLDQLKELVFDKRPALRSILAEHGRAPVGEYLAGAYRAKTTPSPRRTAVIGAVARQAAALLGASVGEAVRRELTERPVVATADHHGPLSHYYFLHSHCLAAAAAPERRCHVVLATSNVSLGNSSYPRGFVGHSLSSGTPELVRLPILRAATRQRPVYRHAPFTEGELGRLERNSAWGALPHGGELRLRVLHLLRQSGLLGAETYSDQVTVLNRALWRAVWPEGPELVYLDLEEVVSASLSASFGEPGGAMCRLLFDPEVRETAVRLLDGVPGAHASFSGKGSVFFWHLEPQSGRRKALALAGGRLAARDGSFSVELEPEAVTSGLARGALVPTTALSLLAVSVDAGLVCTGGFSQTTYLAQLREVYRTLFGEPPLPKHLASVLGGDLLAFFSGSDSARYPLAILDVLGGPLDLRELARTKVREVTVEEALLPLLPELHRMLYPQVSGGRHG